MSAKMLTWAWKMPLSSGQKIVLVALTDNANDEGIAWPHIESLAEKCSLSRSAIITHLKSLHELTLFTKEWVYDERGKRKGTVYKLNYSLSPESIRSLINSRTKNTSKSDQKEDNLSPDLLRTESLRSDLLRTESVALSPDFVALSPESGPILKDEPSYEPSYEPLTYVHAPKVHARNGSNEPNAHVHEHIDEPPDDEPFLFKQFWQIYPRKKNKERTRKLWKKLDFEKKPASVAKIIADIKHRISHEKAWQKKEFIPHPSTYLNEKRWNDEIDPQINSPPNHSRGYVKSQQEIENEKFLGII